MRELLKIVKFDCELERFAEVFGDCIEAEDLTQFLRVCPVPANYIGAVDTDPIAEIYDPAEPEAVFYVLDIATQDRLNDLRKSHGYEPADLKIIKAFFRFVNDAYGWEDLADFERWEEELFDSLNGYQQKNYKPLNLKETEQSRFNLFLQFNRYLKATYGEEVAFQVLQTAENDLSPRERVGLNLGLI